MMGDDSECEAQMLAVRRVRFGEEDLEINEVVELFVVWWSERCLGLLLPAMMLLGEFKH